MKQLTKKQKQTLRLTATYSLMITAIALLVTVLMLAVLGYQFNGKDGRVEQGGLLQFGSNPSGANVTIDDQAFGSQTPARTTYAAGAHTINFNKTGYQPWQKTVTLHAGTILWLNYARLIPAKVTTQTVAHLPALTSAMASSNQQTIAAIGDGTQPTINLFDIANETVKPSTITIPSDVATAPKVGGSQHFSIQSWSDDDRHLLVKHTYDSDAGPSAEWLWIDTDTPKNSKNLTTMTGLPLDLVKFSSGSSSKLYTLSGGDLRRIDVGSSTISSPLMTKVVEFQISDDGLLTYVTGPNADKTRTVGYVSDGATVGRQIREFTDDSTKPLHVATGVYYDQRYVAISYGPKVSVLSADLPDSDSASDITLQSVQDFTDPSGDVQFLSMRTQGRFVVAQTAASYTTYDLELQQTSTATLPGTMTTPHKIDWIDSYHAWSDLDGQLRFYEFDGANPTDIMTIAPGFDATLSQNGKYAYAFTKASDGRYGLTRARLLLQ